VQWPQRVEQLDRQAGDVGRVGGVVVAALGELADAAPRDVATVVEAAGAGAGAAAGAAVGSAGADPLERVDEDAVAQRGLAEREAGDAERGGDALEDEGTGDRDVGPSRFEPRHAGRAAAVRWRTSSPTTRCTSSTDSS
jgi:hypothetical protein